MDREKVRVEIDKVVLGAVCEVLERGKKREVFEKKRERRRMLETLRDILSVYAASVEELPRVTTPAPVDEIVDGMVLRYLVGGEG